MKNVVWLHDMKKKFLMQEEGIFHCVR